MGRTPRQRGWFGHPQKDVPCRVSRFATRTTILGPHRGQRGAAFRGAGSAGASAVSVSKGSPGLADPS